MAADKGFMPYVDIEKYGKGDNSPGIREDTATRAALAICAAIIGAGFASGREIMRFFTAMGSWSWLGIIISSALMGCMAYSVMLLGKKYNSADYGGILAKLFPGVIGKFSKATFFLMMLVCGGAMCAASGELFALAMPVKNAYWIGIISTMLVAYAAAVRGLGLLAVSGGWLIPAMFAFFSLIAVRSGDAVPQIFNVSAVQEQSGALWMILLAVSYAAMNSSMAGGIMCEAGKSSTLPSIKRAAAGVAVIIGGLLLIANAAFLPHADNLAHAALPSVVMAAGLGQAGYAVSIISLWLAMYTTLAAAARSLTVLLGREKNTHVSALISMALIMTIALFDFTHIVGVLYPVLGAVCAVLFVLAAVYSRKNVLQKTSKKDAGKTQAAE